MTSPAATILIVDDEIQNRQLLEALLRPEGYLTRSAANGEEALASIVERAPDLILLDVMMPDMNGYQLTRILKADPATSSIPIIMVTALTDRSARLAGLNAGAEEFLTKPVDRAELWVRVRNLLRLKALGDLLQSHSRTLEQQVQARTAELQRFRTAMDATADAIFLVNRTTMRFVEVNATACNMLGYTREEFFRIGPAELGAGTLEQLESEYDAIIAGHNPEELKELQLLRKDGSRLPVEVTQQAQRYGADWIMVGVLRDITERNNMEEALFAEKERAQVTLNCIGDAVACTDIAGNITFLNLVAEKMTGWPRQDAAGRPMAEIFRIVDATSRETIPNPMERAIGHDRAEHLPSNCILIRRDGSEIPVEDSVAPIHDREGRTTGAVLVFRDVSAAREMVLQMTHSAQHDFLTGLPNRMLLNDRVRQAIALAPRHMKKVAVLFLDLDGFKHINDSLGHAIGDKLLQAVAKRLVDCVRGSDTVSRQGGDEFVVLLLEVEQPEDAAIMARSMLQAVAEPHSIDQHELHVTTSIGVSVYPDDGLNAETLIKNADTAMYQAKENGRQGFQFFTPAMNVRAMERRSIEEGLRRALERREFALHYQPKINLKTGAITGAEALLRWTHPTRGAVAPAQFIPVAEDCGLILPIGKWVLHEACKQARAWIDAGLPVTTMAVNVSAMEFRAEKFLQGVFDILSETGLDPRSLQLDLTESVLMKHAESTASILQTLRERRVQVAVDDFGTGYSSLSYLRKFPVDALKIDQSFVRQITTAGDDAAIVTAVISMARSLKLQVVAEGVETLEELAFLQTHQCDDAQGYYFSRPVPAQQFASLFESGMSAAEPVTRLVASTARDTVEAVGPQRGKAAAR